MDTGLENGIVVKIRQACKGTEIDDKTVPCGVGPRWNTVLKSWSSRIKDGFQKNNRQRPDKDASLSTLLLALTDRVDGLGSRFSDLEAAVHSRNDDKATNKLHVDHQKMLVEKIERLNEQLKVTKKQKDKYKRL